MNSSISSFSENDFQRIAALHYESLEGSILSVLGRKTLENYYRFIASSDTEWLFAIRGDGKVVGACVLSIKPDSVTKRATITDFFPICFKLLFLVFVSADVRAKVWDFLFGSSQKPVLTSGLPEVIQIFADPAYRNRHIGTRLLEQVEDTLRKIGHESFFMKTVAADDNLALHFYRRKGFQELGIFKAGKKNYVYFLKSISQRAETSVHEPDY